MHPLTPRWSVLPLLLVLAGAPAHGLDITTQAFENGRSGANTQETTLTTANVATASFGKLFTIALDSNLGGQVLYRSAFAFGGSIGTHNAIFAYSATSVYAFDADTGTQLWHLALSPTYTNADGNVTNTPVIDTTINYMYFITKIQPSGNNFIHAINLLNGNEGTGSPLQVAGSVSGTGNGSSGGTMTFPSSNANSRPGLLLLNGVIYSGYSNNGDGGNYHGWVVGHTYNPLTGFTLSGIFCDTPNANQGGIWQAGKGLASDGTSVFCTTGNGAFNTAQQSYSMSVLRLTPTALTVADYFTPSNEANESGGDQDLGNCGMAIIPTTIYGFVGSTKYSQGHLVDINNLGHWNGGTGTGNPDACLQTITNTPGTVGTNPVAWNGGAHQYVYLKGGGTLVQWQLNTGSPVSLSQVASLGSIGGEGGLCISSNGTGNGILWVMGTSGQISAYDATNVSNAVLWSTSQNASRDGYNGSNHWQFPLVANGKLYAPDTSSNIVVYGLLATQTPAKLAFVQQPTSTSIGQAISPAVTVAVEDPSGATVAGATNAVTISIGTNPAGGTLGGTLTVAAVNGIATFANLSINNAGTGYTLTAAASGLTGATSTAFNESALAATPVIVPNGGSWSGPVTVTISDATAGAVIHYTTDGTTPGAGSATYTAAAPPVISAVAATTVQAIAIKTGLGNSAVASATITITGTTAYGMPTRPVVTGLNVPATNANPPALLSQTGVFSNLGTMTPAAGIVPYQPNVSLWSDNALKTRWIALPGTSQITFQATGEWAFPGGTILIKNFDIGTDDTDATKVMRLETRLLVLNAAGTNGYGITYQWNAAGTDATLMDSPSYLASGQDQLITISTAGGGSRTQTWHYPSQSECLVCHTTYSGFVLGPKTRQLNGTYTYPATGVSDNQLRTWNYLGMFTTNIGEGNIGGFTHMQPLSATGDTLVDRVKSYIDANCANCHRPGGVNAAWDARYDTAMASANIINGAVAASFGIAGAKVVVPQQTGESMLFYRMNVLGTSPPNPLQMPPVDRHEIDADAITVLAAWIGSLAPTAPVITSVVPGSGTAGTAVAINGSNFTGATAVSFNGTAGSVTVVSATTITTTVPAGATTGTITVTGPNGSGSSPGVFVVGAPPPAPTITALAPTSGSAGSTIVITGTALTATSLVAFNGVAATFTVVSDSEVIATVPASAATGTVAITTPGGTATSSGAFTVVAAGTVPLITAISPAGSGAVGSTLTITGTGLGGASAVTIGGAPATFTENGTGTQITATIPAGSGSGLVSVTTASGTANSSTTFTATATAASSGSSSSGRCGNGIFSIIGLLLLSVVLRRLRLRPGGP